MTSDLSSALEVCFKRDALNKSMFTLLYFTLLYWLSLKLQKKAHRLVAGKLGSWVFLPVE